MTSLKSVPKFLSLQQLRETWRPSETCGVGSTRTAAAAALAASLVAFSAAAVMVAISAGLVSIAALWPARVTAGPVVAARAVAALDAAAAAERVALATWVCTHRFNVRCMIVHLTYATAITVAPFLPIPALA